MNKYKSVKQYDTMDCANACIASIAWYYGKKISPARLQQYTNIKIDGTSVSDIVYACKKIGLNAEAAKKTENFNMDEISCPCIAHVNLENGSGHYIVIYKVRKSDVIISDPALGLIKINKQDFSNFNYTEKSQYIWSGVIIFVAPNKDFLKRDFYERKEHDFLKLILSEKKASVHIIILSLISTILTLVGAFYFKVLLDLIVPNGWVYTLILVSMIFIMIRLSGIFVNKIIVVKSLKFSKNINLKLSLEYYRKILRLPISFLNTRKNGEIISRFQDINNIQEVLILSLLILPSDIAMIISLSIILIAKSTRMFFVVLLICIGYLAIVYFYKDRYLISNSRQMSAKAKTMSAFVESLEGIETIKKLCQEQVVYNSGKENMVKWQNLLVDLGDVENNQSAIKKIVNGLGEIIILCVGSLEVMKGMITVGDLITYNILMSYILSPMNDIIGIQPMFHAAHVAMERLKTIMQQSEEDSEGCKFEKFKQLETNKLDAKYEQSINALKNINFKLKAGEKVAIVGRSGSGKTTLAKLLIKFYLPQSGNIKINDQNIGEISSYSIRQNIIYVSEEDYIFTGSVKQNLTLGESFSDEEILDISEKMGIHDFVKGIPGKYDGILLEKGRNLSKGQRQKIALARAILRKPQVLILDESMSNLDCFSENRILNLLYGNKKMTLIIISHKMNNIIDSDCIYVMDKGQIVAQGTHKELFENCSLYKTILSEGNQ